MFKNYSLLFILFVSFSVFSQRGKNLNYSVTALNTVVNAYTSVTSNVVAGATSISVSSNTLTNAVLPTALAAGDLIMVIQMQGATMDIDPSLIASGFPFTTPYGHNYDWWLFKELWGQVTNYNNAGKYELLEVKSITGGTTINLMCATMNNYTASSHVQVVRVPRFNTLTLSANTSIIPLLWDGTIGGIVALEVDGNLIFNSNSKISATGYGFRGGVTENLTNGSPPGNINDNSLLGSPNATEGAEKGEGIGGWITEYNAVSSRYGRGAPANGGGGGGNHNSGGGGGSNVGTGTYSGDGIAQPGYAAIWELEATGFSTTTSSGGGRGGYSYSTSNQNETTMGPKNTAWAGDYRRNIGGLGGHSLTLDATRLFLGGGGGAGDQNNSQGGNGGRGGGIVYMTVYGTTSGTAIIEANGSNGVTTNAAGNTAPTNSTTAYGNDAAGGAGGGGSIIISNGTDIVNTITLNANGGNGGSQNLSKGSLASPPNEADGPGGGGAGGRIAFTSGSPIQTVTGGVGGTTNSTQVNLFPPNGATNAAAGISGLVHSFFNLTANNATICTSSSANLSVNVIGTIPSGGTITWFTTQFGSVSVATGTTYTTPVLSATTTYYVGTCPGTFRIPVTVTVGGPTISGTANVTNATCTTPGSITGLTTSGGVPTISITWNGVSSPGMNLSNASAGNYTVVVTDGAGCTATSGPYTISSGGGPVISTASMVVNPESCIGNDGSISGISVSGGSTPYTISWNSGVYSTLNINSLVAGNYSLLVTDNVGCTASLGPIAVNQTAGPSLNTTNQLITNETCSQGNGAISGITSTGNSLTFTWNGVNSTTENISNLSAGSYTLVATDNLGCTASVGPIAISNFAPPTLNLASILLSDDHCSSSIGSISGIQIQGGTPNYTISWNSGAFNTIDISSIPSGSYSLLVTDMNGCTANAGPFTINNVPPPSISTTSMVITNESCSGNDGSITGIVATGSGLSYTWNFNPSTSTDLLNISAGTYGLIVTDAFGCMTSAGPFTITAATPMNLDSTNLVIQNSGCTVNIGSINGLSVVGGINPTILWSNSSTSLNLSNLASGNYTITVTDDQNCIISASFNVGTLSGPTIASNSVVLNPETCSNTNGSISNLSVSNGTEPYVYQWDGNSTFNQLNLSGVAGGNHTLFVTDSVGCTAQVTLALLALNGPIIDISSALVTNATCIESSGSVNGIAVTGNGPFIYTWTNTSLSTLNIFGLSAGSYTLTVTDSNACSSSTNPFVINSSPLPFADFTYPSGDLLINQPINFVDATTGAPVNSWNWSISNSSDSGTSSIFTTSFLNEGTYEITLVVSSADGCMDSITKIITISGELIIPNVITRNEDQVNDLFVIKNLKPNTKLTIVNRWGSVAFQNDHYLNDWDGTDLSGNKLTEGVYFYQLINAEGKSWQGYVQLLNK